MEFYHHIHCKYTGIKGFKTLHNYSLRYQYMITEKAKHRAKVLAFWEKHGLDATMDAFGVKRRTLFGWKRKLKESNGKLEALNDQSKAPKTRRVRLWPDDVIAEIKRLRDDHPNLGKDKIYPELRKFCLKRNLKCPDVSTIGRIIKDCGGLRKYPQKISHFGKIKKVNRKKVLRKPKNLKAKYPGHVVALDTIEKYIDGIRRYIITFEDIHTRLSFAWATSSHASAAAKEFFEYCVRVFPFPFTFVLTDNGSEFKKHFAAALNELHLIHYHTYPKCPKMNSHCERFNRTIQEEYIDYHVYELLDCAKFNRNLMDWLIWYNTERVHYAFENKLSPFQYLLSLNASPMECKRRWTYSSPVLLKYFDITFGC